MFGKKKAKGTETVDVNCKVCGANCLDQGGMERHMAWVHRGAGNPGEQKGKETGTLPAMQSK